MNVQVLSREWIKPSTPTPPSLRNYKISLVDELSPTLNIPLILYYPCLANAHNNNGSSISKCNQLKKSLAETLTGFYVLAGRYMKDGRSVDCSDQGAEFVEAQVDIPLTDLLGQGKNLKTELLNNLLPRPLGASDEITDPLLAVQISIFGCGSLAIGFCVSHRVADMSTLGTFVKVWATTSNREEGIASVSPSFNTASFFPGRNVHGLQFGLPRTKEDIQVHKIVTKKFSFNKNAISSIRAKVSLEDSSKRQPSKVQSVIGVIWKALVDINAAKDGQPKDFMVVQAVNIRERTVPPLPKYMCGNLYMIAISKSLASESGMELSGCVDRFSETVKKNVEDCAKILLNGEDGQMMLINPVIELNKTLYNPEKLNAGIFSSWCRFSFYDADFGWGKPIWVSSVNLPMKNSIMLFDDKAGDGIEAWVNLDEKDMPKFEQDCNIRCFTT